VTVLVDTPIWSLALRRRHHQLSLVEQRLVQEWSGLVRRDRALLVGPIRQEILSGIRRESDFEVLRERLQAFPDVPLHTRDHEEAARFFNQCRNRGVTGSPIDLLLCAVAHRRDLSIFTLDTDFERYARHVPVRLHGVPRAR
jgi:predicted nucleic acid-binding protein